MPMYTLIHGNLKLGKKTLSANKADPSTHIKVELTAAQFASLPKGVLMPVVEKAETAKVAPKDGK